MIFVRFRCDCIIHENQEVGNQKLENQETLKQKFYDWVRLEVDEMPKRNYNIFNDMTSRSLNNRNDFIWLYLGNPSKIWMFIKSGENESPERTKRMLGISNEIRNRLSEQSFREEFSKYRAQRGWSIRVQKDWALGNLHEWPLTVYWVRVQFKRLKEIISDFN